MSMLVPVDLEFMSQNLKYPVLVLALPVPLQLAEVPQCPTPQFIEGSTVKVTGNVHARVP